MNEKIKLIELEKRLFEYQGEDRIVTSHELYAELLKSSNTIVGVPTGIPTLDRVLEKVEPGELVVLTGPTDEGKSTLAMTITRNMADAGTKVVWFTMEITPRQFITKIIRKVTDSTKLPLFYIPNKIADNTFQWIEERILEAKVKHDARVVFIDHIHQIFSIEKLKYGNVSLELGDLMAKIKATAIKYDLIIFLIAHTRDDSQRPNSEPTKESLRDSGLIGRIADTIIAIWRMPTTDDPEGTLKMTVRSNQAISENDNWAKVRILKNRRAGMRGVFLMEHKDHHLTEIDLKYVEKVKQMDYEKEADNIFGI